jgi:hypothetical protein
MLPGMSHIATSVALAICLLGLQALAYPAVIEHASQHVHHGADVHGTVLCTWMCAAGQVIEGVAVTSLPERQPTSRLEQIIPRTPLSVAIRTLSSRGPPADFLL